MEIGFPPPKKKKNYSQVSLQLVLNYVVSFVTNWYYFWRKNENGWKVKVSNFTKLPLMSFLESSGVKFDRATRKVTI